MNWGGDTKPSGELRGVCSDTRNARAATLALCPSLIRCTAAALNSAALHDG
jgi:hypothetical protein